MLPLGLDDLGEGLGVGVLELLTFEILAGHGVHERERAVDLLVAQLDGRGQQFLRRPDPSGQRIACKTMAFSRTRSSPRRSRPDQAYFATATLLLRSSAMRSHLYGFAATCPLGAK
nr:hypothetical protein [Streptomyces cahuitamycinicus]